MGGYQNYIILNICKVILVPNDLKLLFENVPFILNVSVLSKVVCF